MPAACAQLAGRLGTRWPLIQAPMAGVQDHALAAAVCQAGGLGSLPAAIHTPESLTDQVQRLRAATDAPYNVNFFCHTTPPPDPQREAAWRQLLAPYYDEYKIDSKLINTGGGRAPFSSTWCDWVESHRPAVVSFHFGLPADDLLQRVKATGAVVLSSATTLAEGLWLQARGVDAVIAQGLEAGGHRGMFLSDDLNSQVGTLTLVRALVMALRIPVIATGGICDAAGVRAALALGASGVQVGTAYLHCPESTLSTLHRQAIASPRSADTALTRLFTGRPARGISNRLMRELGPLNPAAPAFPMATAALAPLRAAAESVGCDDFSPLWAGQCAGPAHGLPAGDFTRQLAQGFAP